MGPLLTLMSKTITSLSLALLALLAVNTAGTANAQQYQYAPAALPQVAQTASPAPTYYYQSNYYATAQPPPSQPPSQPQYYYPAPQPTGDPYGFTAWLNATRASYGLAPVGYDPNLAGWAAQNNAHQLS